MATLKLNSYELFSQSSTNRPEYGSGAPAGTVVQQVIKNQQIGNGTLGNAHELVGNSLTYTSVFFNLNITTKLANSRIHLFAQSPYVYIQSGTTGEFWFNRSTDNIDINRPGDGKGYIEYSSGGGGGIRTFTAYDTPNVAAGIVLNYVMKYKRISGSNSAYLIYDRGQFGIFTITEIAA